MPCLVGVGGWGGGGAAGPQMDDYQFTKGPCLTNGVSESGAPSDSDDSPGPSSSPASSCDINEIPRIPAKAQTWADCAAHSHETNPLRPGCTACVCASRRGACGVACEVQYCFFCQPCPFLLAPGP